MLCDFSGMFTYEEQKWLQMAMKPWAASFS